MGLFSGKKKTDPAYTAAQAQAAGLTDRMLNQKLPALPTFSAAQQAQMTPKVTVPASLPSYLGGGANTVYPAGMPNQLSMIAQQLGAGGYGAPTDIAAQLSGIYRPQTVAPTPPPIAAKPMGFTAQKATPAAAVFPWQAYAAAHPYIQLGPHTTLSGEGGRAWLDYLKTGSKWKAPGSTASTPYTSPWK